MPRYVTSVVLEVGIEVGSDRAADAQLLMRQVADDLVHLVNTSGWPVSCGSAHPNPVKESL